MEFSREAVTLVSPFCARTCSSASGDRGPHDFGWEPDDPCDIAPVFAAGTEAVFPPSPGPPRASLFVMVGAGSAGLHPAKPSAPANGSLPSRSGLSPCLGASGGSIWLLCASHVKVPAAPFLWDCVSSVFTVGSTSRNCCDDSAGTLPTLSWEPAGSPSALFTRTSLAIMGQTCISISSDTAENQQAACRD
jgi:hypothetical protein